MKTASRPCLLLFLAALWFASLPPASADLVYDNTTNYTVSLRFDPLGHEIGDEIILAGSARLVTNFAFQYFGENFSGNELARLRFYKNDGPVGTQGAPEPGTVLYDSGFFSIGATPGAVLIFDALNVTVPTDFTWSIFFSGIENGEKAGVQIFSPPDIGNGFADYWDHTPTGWKLKTFGQTNVDFAARIEASPSAVTSACVPPPPGLISWWRAEGDANDETGANPGELRNGAAFVLPAKVGRGLAFNGTDAYFSAPDSVSLHPANLTLEGWFSFASGGGTQVLAAKALGGGTSDSFVLFTEDGVLKAAVGDAAGLDTALAYDLSPVAGNWYHLAYTYDATTGMQALYVDGLERASGTGGKMIEYDSQPLTIGADTENGNPSQFFNGKADEVAIYGRALTDTEIRAIYRAGDAGKCPLPRLTIHKEGDQLLIQWPADVTGNELKSTPSLSQPDWTGGYTVEQTGEFKTVRITPDQPRLFFRLAPP